MSIITLIIKRGIPFVKIFFRWGSCLGLELRLEHIFYLRWCLSWMSDWRGCTMK